MGKVRHRDGPKVCSPVGTGQAPSDTALGLRWADSWGQLGLPPSRVTPTLGLWRGCLGRRQGEGRAGWEQLPQVNTRLFGFLGDQAARLWGEEPGSPDFHGAAEGTEQTGLEMVGVYGKKGWP